MAGTSQKTIETSTDGRTRLVENTLMDGSKTYDVVMRAPATLPSAPLERREMAVRFAAEDEAQAHRVFAAVAGAGVEVYPAVG